MTDNFRKIIFLVFFLQLFLGASFAHAQPFSGTEDVTITAKVGVEVVDEDDNPHSGSVSFPSTAVRFSGLAYPYAKVTVLKGGIERFSVVADKDANFSITLPEEYSGNVLYTLFAEDLAGNKSLLINYPLAIFSGYVTHLSGIRFAPTVVLDKTEVRFGDYLTANGYSVPNQKMEIIVEGKEKRIYNITSYANGIYEIVIPLGELPRGEYSLYSKYINDARISKLVKFTISDVNILSTDLVENIPGDCNADSIINLVDFSVLAFWYGKLNPPKCVDTNVDNKIDLTDFSILAFWWTG